MITDVRNENDLVLAELVDEITRRLQVGESVNVDSLAHEHPELTNRLRELLPTLQLLQHLKNESQASGASPVSQAARDASGSQNGTSADGLMDRTLGDFRIVREIGRGGMGVVYEAEQISLGRTVALKVLPFAAMLDSRQLARFRNESRAAATLHHHNIVPVFSVGCERSVHFYAMQYIEGESLARIIEQLRRLEGVSGNEQEADPSASPERLAELSRALASGQLAGGAPLAVSPLTDDWNPAQGQSGITSADDHSPDVPWSSSTPLPFPTHSPAADTASEAQAFLSTARTTPGRVYFRTVAELGIQAAEALDHAHELGVIHRDIKPANLLLDETGRLWITDFGLARLESDAGMTMTGDLLGTLRYMSPEQALAKRVVVDHRTDVYSLGVTLYELLALRPAFNGEDRQHLLKQIAFDDPPLLRKLNRQIPAELETIIEKAIRKNPEERYATAHDLADDLRNFLQHKPIKAKPPTWREQLLKWSSRHPAAVWAAILVLLATTFSAAASAVLIAQSRKDANAQRIIATQEKDNAIAQRSLALGERNKARLNQYYAEIVSGQADLEHGNIARLHQKLIRHLPLDNESDCRGWEWYYLFSYCHPERRALYHPLYRRFVAWSPDGEYLATAGVIWKTESGECTRLFTPSLNLQTDVAWSPDSNQLAWAGCDPIYIWNRQTDSVRALHGHKNTVWCVAFSPDGKQLASGSIDHTLKVWDLSTGDVVRTIPEDDNVCHVAWSPDGELLAVGIGGGVHIYSVATGMRLAARGEPNRARVRVSWRPDGRQLAVNTPGHWYILDRSDWKRVGGHDHEFVGTSGATGADIAWNPSGTQLAIAHGNVVTIWDPANDQPVSTLTGHIDLVNSVAWSPDGRQLITSDAFSEIRIWELQSSPQPPVIVTGAPLTRLSWESNSDTLISVAKSDLSSSIWNVTDGKQIKIEKPALPDGANAAILSPNGRLVAQLSGTNNQRTITVRDASSGSVRSIWRPEESFEPIAFSWSPDGSKMAISVASDRQSRLECWDVYQEQTTSRWSHPKVHPGDNLTLPTWSPDGVRVAVIGLGDPGENGNPIWSSHVHVIDVVSGQRILKRPFGNRPRYGGSITALAWSRDARFLALGSSDGMLDVVDIEAGKGAMSCRAHDMAITALAWSPNGERLVTAAADGAVKLLEARMGGEVLTLHTANAAASQLVWSADGKRLAAATDEGTIQVWDASRGYEFAAGSSRQGELAWAYVRLANDGPSESIDSALRRSLELAPKTLGFRLLRGPALAYMRQYDDAAKEFGAAVPRQADLGFAFSIWRAYALLGSRDLDAFRDLHKTLVHAVANSDVMSDGSHDVAWLGALIPGVIDGFEENVKLMRDELAKTASEGKEGLDDSEVLQLGAMLYRLRQYKDAVNTLGNLSAKLSEATDQESQYTRACAEYFLAMAHFQLGHEIQARRLLESARAVDDSLLAGPILRWWHRVALDTLCREATGLIDDRPSVHVELAPTLESNFPNTER